MKEQIRFIIGKQEANIQEQLIQIPEGNDGIYLTVDIAEEFRYMAFLFLEDPEKEIRLQKLLGHGELNLGVGKDTEDTTIGGVPGRIIPGTWKIGVGIFTEYVAQKLGDRTGEIVITVSNERNRISDPIQGECWVENGLRIENKCYQWENVLHSESRWYKGDFHTHTRLSDGKETIQHASERAEKNEMDYYVPTEHNLMHTGWCKTSLCIIPGIEVTTDKGHMNLFGITEMPERITEIVRHNGEDIIEDYIGQTIEEAKEKGWIRSINHPFLTIWKWQIAQTDLRDINCVEIINDPTYPDAPMSNDLAILFLDEAWKAGIRIFGVGGSDSHNLENEFYDGTDLPSVVGDPATWVFCDGLSPVNLLQAVRKGHVCVTRFCQIEPEIEVDGQRYLPGDEITANACEMTYKADIFGRKETPEVFIVIDGEYRKLPVTRTSEEQYHVNIKMTLERVEWQWIRMEIRTKEQEFLGYVNPVYRGKKEAEKITFGEIAKRIEELKND